MASARTSSFIRQARGCIRAAFLCVLPAMLLAGCGWVDQSMPEFLQKYTETAAVGRTVLGSVSVADESGTSCLPSDDDKTITLYLRNPQNYTLNVGYVLHDGTEAAAPAVTIVQDASDKSVVRLTFAQSWLLAHEGGGDIGGTVTLQESATLREFDGYGLDLKCNTPPPGVEGALLQLAPNPDVPGGKEYVLCFFWPASKLAAATHSPDTHVLHVGSEELDDVAGLMSPVPNLEPARAGGPEFDARSAPLGYTPCYYRTGVGSGSVSYKVWLTDSGGLSSPVVSASNTTEQLSPVTASSGGEEIAAFDDADPDTVATVLIDEETGYAAVTLSAPASTTEGNSVSGATVHYTVTPPAGAPVTGSKAGSVALKLTDAGDYLIEAYASKTYYAESAPVSFYVTVAQGANLYVSQTGSDDTGTGSMANPFATMQKAFDTLAGLEPDAGREACIFVSGTVKGGSMLDIPAAQAKSVTIQKASGARSAVLDGQNDTAVGSVMIISTAVPVTFKNVTITNGLSTTGGGGLYVGASADVTLGTGTVVSGCESNLGGGVYAMGTVTVDGGTIQGNTASQMGGGVLIGAGGSLVLADGSITGNTSDSMGGGIYAMRGHVTIDGGTISNNSAGGSGGGIMVMGDLCTMTDGTISGNSAGMGGGVMLMGSATFDMQGGTLRSNTVSGSSAVGGALYLPDATSGTFRMSGAASISYGGAAGKNDIYMTVGATTGPTVTVGGALTGTGTVATITLSSYTAGTQVLSGDDALLAANHEKFALSDTDSGLSINEQGKLAGDLLTEIYVSAGGSDTTGTGKESAPFATIQRACQLITEQASPEDYTIYIVGTLTGIHELPAADTANAISLDATTAQTIMLCGVSASSKGVLDGAASADSVDSLLWIKTRVPVTLKNLTIKGHTLRNSSSGGGMGTSSGTDVTLSSGVTISGNSAPGGEGGALWVGGSLTMESGCTIENNSASGGTGGGIYVDSGASVTINGGTIKGNSAQDGGGLWVKGSATIQSAALSQNTATQYGGALYMADGSASIDGSELTQNKAVKPAGSSGHGNGGAIYVMGGTLVLGSASPVTITGNTASDYGGAICNKGTVNFYSGTISGNIVTLATGTAGGAVQQSDGTFGMHGGKITANTAPRGGGIEVYGGTFTMEGDAVVTADNDVSLGVGRYITVGGSLTGTAPVATITPPVYTAGTQVLTGTGVATGYGKFAVSDSAWCVDSAGKLAAAGTGTINSSSYTGSNALNELVAAIQNATGDVKVVMSGALAFSLTSDQLRLIANAIKSTTADSVALDLSNCLLPSTPFPPTIADATFADCEKLTEITLPNSLVSIGSGAFKNTGLTSIAFPAFLSSIGIGAFDDTPLQSATFFNSSGSWLVGSGGGAVTVSVSDAAANARNLSDEYDDKPWTVIPFS